MTNHPNAERVHALFKAFHEGDIETVQAALADDVVWHFPGRDGQLAGSHRGQAAVFEFLALVPGLTGGTFHLDLEDVVAGDELAVAFFRGHGTRAEDSRGDGSPPRTLDNPTCLKIRMKDGKAVELWEFVWDLYAVDSFWS